MAQKRAKKKPATKKTKPKPEEPEKTCFVIMPFDPALDQYYRPVIVPAIEQAGLEAKRADDLFRSSMIVRDIWAMIQKADVLLAVLTTRNANVFYELGLAHAIGKPVVLISETMDDVPFDLRHVRVVLYDKDDYVWGPKLGDDIKTAIEETLKDPDQCVPDAFATPVQSQAPARDELEIEVRGIKRQLEQLSRRSRPFAPRRVIRYDFDEGEFVDLVVSEMRDVVDSPEWAGFQKEALLDEMLRKEWPDMTPNDAIRILRRFKDNKGVQRVLSRIVGLDLHVGS